jgi:predicted amidohydrolase
MTLTAARAIKNQVFVVACNRIGTDAGITFCGTTMIIDPYGTVLASASAIHEGIVFADIDLKMIQIVRSQIKVHQDRRPTLYGTC